MKTVFIKLSRRQLLSPQSFLLTSLQRFWLPVAVGLAVLSVILPPLNLLAVQRFHRDEALYATWALNIISGNDPWLKETPVDKPPLFLYLVAGAMWLLGVTETTARTPSLVATGLIVLLTFWLGRRCYSDGQAALAAWLTALSPFTLLFAPTAFTDPTLVALALAGCLAAASTRPILAGMCLALAIAAKQQGLFFIPLAIGLLFLGPIPPPTCPLRLTSYPGSAKPPRGTARREGVLRFTLSLCLTLLPFLIWDFSRHQPSAFLEESLKNYGGLAVDSAGFTERWLGFVALLYYGTASPCLNIIFLIGCPLLLIDGALRYRGWRMEDRGWRIEDGGWRLVLSEAGGMETRRWRMEDGGWKDRDWREVRGVQVDGLLFLFSFLFLALHAFLSFQVWDRYLLGLIPLLALLLARVLFLPWTILKACLKSACSDDFSRQIRSLLSFKRLKSLLRVSTPARPGQGKSPVVSSPGQKPLSWVGIGYGLGLALLLSFTLAGPVQDAVNGRYPLGSHSQALQGIEQVVAYLQGHVGANHTLYHRWLGTHWRFYLWAYPYDLQYWATPEELVSKVQPGAIIAYPAWQSETEVRLALFKAGFGLRELMRAYRMDGTPSVILYEIETLR